MEGQFLVPSTRYRVKTCLNARYAETNIDLGFEAVNSSRSTRAVRIVSWVAALLTVLSPTARACSDTSIPAHFGSRFFVQVRSEGDPIQGLKIHLETVAAEDDENRVVQTHVTDTEGTAYFDKVKPGRYYVEIDSIAYSQSEEIVVDAGASSDSQTNISFEWPVPKALSVRSVAGLLTASVSTGNWLDDQIHPAFTPLASAKLTLLDGVSGEVLESDVASESGAFSFRPVPAGLYILHIELPEDAKSRYRVQGGYVPVKVGPAAKVPSLDLYLYPGICGALGFENRQGVDSR